MKKLEVDFICNLGRKKYYIQSAFSIPNKEKMKQETKSLVNINDSFKKIIIVRDDINLWQNKDGILIMNIEDFLLDKNSFNDLIVYKSIPLFIDSFLIINKDYKVFLFKK